MTEIRKMKKDDCESPYAHRLGNLGEMDKFLETNYKTCLQNNEKMSRPARSDIYTVQNPEPYEPTTRWLHG